MVENARDFSGRPGVGLRFKDRDGQATRVFDEKTLTYLGSDKEALLGTGVADQVGRTPGG